MLFLIVGVGGTGSILAPLLSRMLDDCKFVLFDGDIIEMKNISRQAYQSFNLGENKAYALARKLNSNFDNEHYFFDKYIEKKEDILHFLNLGRYDEKVVLISCVDNNSTRKILEDTFDLNKIDLYIDSGNEDTFGNVFVSTQEKHLYRTFYVENLDDHPSRHCQALIEEGNKQQYQLNYDMALTIGKVVFDYYEGRKIPCRIEINGFNRKAYFK